MKKILLNLFVFFLVLISFVIPDSIKAKSKSINYDITAQSAILMEKTTKRVLFKKNSDLKLPMASCTKILTAITVLQNANVDDMITIPKQAVGIEGSSLYLKEGEQLTVKELLYGLMLRSGNDCAVALGMHVSQTIEKFML